MPHRVPTEDHMTTLLYIIVVSLLRLTCSTKNQNNMNLYLRIHPVSHPSHYSVILCKQLTDLKL